jgi:flagellar hook assembly protein FlgD
MDGNLTWQEVMSGEDIKLPAAENITVYLKVETHVIPKEYSLAQNYPNPFNPVTTIRYGLPVDSRVTLKIYNILGQEVKTLVNEAQGAGYKEIEWNASNLASGVYMYRLTAGNYSDVKRMLLIK